MAGKAHAQQAAGAAQNGAVAFKNDAQNIRGQAANDAAIIDDEINSLNRQIGVENTRLLAQAGQEENSSANDDIRRDIERLKNEISEAENRKQQILADAEKRAGAAESAAAAMESAAGSLGSVLSRSDIE